MAGLLDDLMSDPAKLAMLQAGIGILSNNRGNYGRAGPAIGAGMQQGMQGLLYAQALKREEDKKKGMQNWLQQMPRSTQTPTGAPTGQPLDGGAAGDLSQLPVMQARQLETRQPSRQELQDWALAGMEYNPGLANKVIEQQFAGNEYSTTPQYDQNGRAFVLSKDGSVKYLDGVQARDKKENVNGVWVNPYDTKVHGVAPPDPNKAFGYRSDGSIAPNSAFQNYEMSKSRAGAARNVVNISQEKEENKTVGKFFGEQYGNIQQAAFNANSKINKINRMNQLLDGVQTGKFTPLGVEVASAAASLGINIDPKLGNKQAAEALANEMALEMRNPAGGAGMPGAMSDKDREFLANMTPNLSKTPEGRKMISDTAVKIAQRDKEVAKLAADYRKKNGTLDEGFYDVLNQSFAGKPLFPEQNAAPAAPASTGIKFLGFE